jgi:hypothetical protein
MIAPFNLDRMVALAIWCDQIDGRPLRETDDEIVAAKEAAAEAPQDSFAQDDLRALVAFLRGPIYVCAGCGTILDTARVGPSKLGRQHLALDGECLGCTIYCPRVVRVGGVE